MPRRPVIQRVSARGDAYLTFFIYRFFLFFLGRKKSPELCYRDSHHFFHDCVLFVQFYAAATVITYV